MFIFWMMWALSMIAGQITNDGEYIIHAVICFSALKSLFDLGGEGIGEDPF